MDSKPKPPKPARPRTKLSFAIDRDEIDISSEWVEAVMERSAATPAADNSTVEQGPRPTIEPTVPATVAESAPGALSAADLFATVAENDTHAEISTPIEHATGARFGDTNSRQPVSRQVEPVGKIATVAKNATITLTYQDQTTRAFRPRNIRSVADGLTPGQLAVYGLMFQRGEKRDNEGRLYRGGYADLCQLTGMSKRGIQNVIAELKSKTCITVHEEPGYHRSQMTTYRIYAEETILATWYQRGIRYAIGKGKELISDPATIEPTM